MSVRRSKKVYKIMSLRKSASKREKAWVKVRGKDLGNGRKTTNMHEEEIGDGFGRR